ncbi:MAG: TonB-dependent receptor [Cyclobacteriaceae bacterium]
MKYLICLFLSIGTYSLYAQTYTISGYIRDSETGENLIGATILDQNTLKGTVSNTYGFYSLTMPEGKLSLKITYVGYEFQEANIQLNENKQLNYNLKAGSTLDEVVITAEENIELSPQMSTIDVPIEQIKALPVLMGESDILKTLQLLPGIQGGTEGSSGIYVRGGGADQNLILLDGVPVYNVSHLFGFFSVFNPDAINRVNVVKGGFPARYGGRLSSVIDISMKEGNNQKFAGEGSIGLISSKLTLEGPIGKSQKTSFIVSGRRTYIDLLTRPIIRASSGGDATGGYYFYDLNAKINHKISNKDRLYLSFYNGLDKAFAEGKSSYRNSDNTEVEEKNDFGLTWGNIITALRWNHVFNPKLFANISGTYSKYKFKIFGGFESTTDKGGEKTVEKGAVEYFSGIDDFAAKIDFDYLPSPQHNIKMGASSIHHTFNPGVFGIDSNVEGENDTIIGGNRTQAIEFLTYVEDDFSITNDFRINAGLHYSGFQVGGKYYHSLQPRFSARYLMSKDLSIKASFATMTQYIHLLTNGGLGLPTDLWVPATKRVSPQQSWQVALGTARTFNGYEMSIETYYKEMSGLIEYQEGASYFNLGSDWQDKITKGSGESYGAEFLLQKKTGKLSGWVGYTLSWTNRTFDDLNFGEKFPYKYDRRHDISIVSVYEVSENFSISGTWVFGTGNAVTIPESNYTYHEEYNQYPSNHGGFSQHWEKVENFGSRNDYRMRSYHRLDFGMTWEKEKKWGHRTWSIGVYNLYNRKNPFFIDTTTDSGGNEKFVQFSLFPAIPYVRYGFVF